MRDNTKYRYDDQLTIGQVGVFLFAMWVFFGVMFWGVIRLGWFQ